MNIDSPAAMAPPSFSDKIIQDMQNYSDELDTSLDPKMSLRKRIIEALFYKDKEKNPQDKIKTIGQDNQAASKSDTVTISQTAIELYAAEKSSASATLKNADGSTVTVTIEHEAVVHFKATTTQQEVKSSDPLIFDLGSNGVQLTDVTKGQGVRFDINGDGQKENVSWIAPQDGILVYDKNSNGIIDNGKELFGDQNGAKSGFEELAKYDGDHNGFIDSNDAVFNNLYLWQDKNRDGISTGDELKNLASYGITRINLKANAVTIISGGNTITATGAYDSARGKGEIAEAYLNYFG
ncbi:MAG: hypothetical protein PHC61_05600 [Chitinivibrionales bacterium]|nr:hypothetical protein [Chitinivibrionales bacterium]